MTNIHAAAAAASFPHSSGKYKPDRPRNHAAERPHRTGHRAVGQHSDHIFVTIQVMKRISIQALKARLSAAVAEAESGETIVITRHQAPVAS